MAATPPRPQFFGQNILRNFFVLVFFIVRCTSRIRLFLYTDAQSSFPNMKTITNIAIVALIFICIFDKASHAADGAEYPSRMFPALALSNWKSSILLWGATRDNANQTPFK